MNGDIHMFRFSPKSKGKFLPKKTEIFTEKVKENF